MKSSIARLGLAFASAALMALAGCGGGGGSASTSSSSTPAASGPVVFSGVAATGAPFGSALLTVYDQTGSIVGTTTTGLDGGYTIQLAANAKAPFVVEATLGDVTLVSTFATANSTTLNVTPVTTLIASRLSPDGNPVNLKTTIVSNPDAANATQLAAKVAEVVAILKPLLDAIGDSTNPLTGSFTADGTKYDKVLDSLSITINPTGTGANIEIGVRQQTPDGSQPNVIQFSSSATSVPPLAAVSSSSLVPDGTSVQIADLIKRLTACYALPLTSRVSGATSASTSVNGTASAVIAPECRSLFLSDDPATFRSNGNIVGNGPSTNGNWSFSSFFKSGATGLLWSNGNYEFTRGNGDIVFSYTNNTSGNISYGSLAARAVTQNGSTVLKLVGNQYAYPGSVYAYHQFRQFITLGQSAFDYYSSGYNLDIPNWQTSTATPVFDRVEATSPKGNTITFKPKAAVSNLVITSNPAGTMSSATSYIRLRSVYADSSNTADPMVKDTNLSYASPAYSDADLASLPAQSVWTLKYFLAGNTSSTPDATQTYKTQARPLTIAELKTKGLASITSAMLADLQDPAGIDPTTGVLIPPQTSQANFRWDVPTGAIAPTSAKIFGKYSGGSFDDSNSFGSTARQVYVSCTSLGGTDTHCAGGTNGGFTSSARVTGLHLYGTDSTSRAYAHFYATYKLN